MKKNVILAVLLAITGGCGGDPASNGAGGSGGIERDPCNYDTDCVSPLICDQNGSGVCVVCIVGDDATCPEGQECLDYRCEAKRPSCDGTVGSCAKIGYPTFNCESGKCVPGCLDSSDCCPYDKDGNLFSGEDCADYECRTDGSESCERLVRVADCNTCTTMNWECHVGTTQHTCYLDKPDVCIRASEDCSSGQICLEDRCTACTPDAGQCPGSQVCNSGLCQDPDPANPADNCSVDSNCDYMDNAASGVDAYCSTKLSPRNCTVSCNGATGNPGQANRWCVDLVGLNFTKCNSDKECEK